MANLAKVNQLLDDYLYGRMSPENMQSAYSKTIQPAYNKLTYRNADTVFHENDNFKGYADGTGSIYFKRKIPGYGESYYSPEELLQGKTGTGPSWIEPEQRRALEIAANAPQPARDLIRLNKGFQAYSQSPEGSRLFFNEPASEHRAKAYKNMGFEYPEHPQGYNGVLQYYDTRPNASNEMFNKLYMIGDIDEHGVEVAQTLLNQRAQKNNLGSRVANLQSKLSELKEAHYNAPYTLPVGLDYPSPSFNNSSPTITQTPSASTSNRIVSSIPQLTNQPINQPIPSGERSIQDFYLLVIKEEGEVDIFRNGNPEASHYEVMVGHLPGVRMPREEAIAFQNALSRDNSWEINLF